MEGTYNFLSFENFMKILSIYLSANSYHRGYYNDMISLYCVGDYTQY